MSEPENTEVVLPIICPNCKHELNLGMFFALLETEKNTSEVKHKENEDESEEA